jgi:hypothetical protein
MFTEMLADILSNGCRTIIVERLDRLARDLGIQNQLVVMLCSKGLTLISTDTQQDVTATFSGDPMLLNSYPCHTHTSIVGPGIRRQFMQTINDGQDVFIDLDELLKEIEQSP